jgi:hypothetical protein
MTANKCEKHLMFLFFPGKPLESHSIRTRLALQCLSPLVRCPQNVDVRMWSTAADPARSTPGPVEIRLVGHRAEVAGCSIGN